MSNQIILLSVLFAIIFGFSFNEASAAVDMFIKIKDIDGESKDKTHGNEIDVLSLKWSSAMPSSSTLRVSGAIVEDFSFTKYIDKASPKLLESLASGKHIEEVKLTVRKAGGNPVEYLKYTLRDVMVTNYSTGGSGGEDRPTESISLSYGKIEVEYTEINPDGTPGKVTVRGWDPEKKQTYCPDAAGTCGDLPADVLSPIEREKTAIKEPTETKKEKMELRKMTLPKDKPGTIPVSGEIEYKKGVPLEVILEKPDGTSESFTVLPESSGEYDTEIPIPEDLASGLYTVKVKYDTKEVESFSISILKEMVPSWIKNNAKWWSEKQIGDSDFIGGIQFMIQEKIILVSGQPAGSAQDDAPVPEWVRNNAGWWADDLISEDEFVKALEFLIQNGIIKIS
ncbi:MAG TPA: type VI secretion system tube protein TssD [Nitrosopumilaceae archaeon]|nr:type VI secretion system tube protein TssD [Nitrosopumilaceae archaeon]